jgi:hypothetical protein
MEKGNESYLIKNDFLLNVDGTKLIRYLGFSESVVIPRNVEVIGSLSFAQSRLSSISFECDSRLRLLESKAFHFCILRRIEIPRSVEVIGSDCFSLCNTLSSCSHDRLSILFEEGSRLQRIEARAFASGLFGSIKIPRSVAFIDGSTFGISSGMEISIEAGNAFYVMERKCIMSLDRTRFVRYAGLEESVTVGRNVIIIGLYCFSSCCSLSSILFEPDSQLTMIEPHAFSQSSLRSITIPGNVVTIGRRCFWFCNSLLSISFVKNSQLQRIESKAFSESSLESINIPQHVSFIDGSAFATVKNILISVESENRSFKVHNNMIWNYDETQLIRYFGSEASIIIPKSVEVICSKCFYDVKSILSISFERDSQLKRLESGAFHRSSLTAFAVPRNVKEIGPKCFSSCEQLSSFSFEYSCLLKRLEASLFLASGLQCMEVPCNVEVINCECFCRCKDLVSVLFENESQLQRIETKAFAKTKVRSITLPILVVFIAGDAFSIYTDIVMANDLCGREFCDWDLIRQLDSTVNFEVKIG